MVLKSGEHPHPAPQMPVLAIPVPLCVRNMTSKAGATPLNPCQMVPSSFSAYRRINQPSLHNVKQKETTPTAGENSISPLVDQKTMTPNMQPAAGPPQDSFNMSQQMPLNSTASLVQALSILSRSLPVDNQNKFDGNQPDESVEGTKKRRKSSTKRTRIACLPCALSKSACHAERPCARCVRLSMADQCVNRVHRKMGRPRRQHSTRLVELDMLHHSLNKSTGQSTPIRVSSALWAAWRSAISVCCEQKLVPPRFWTQVLQKFLCGNDLEEYTELCSCGHLDHTEAGEISIVSGLLPGRFEHVPAPVISFDIHAGDVCAFTLNSQAHSLFGRDRSEFEQILNSAIPGSSFQDNVQALSDLLKLVSCESWSSIFNMIKDVCLGVKYDFVSEVSVVSKNGNAISCLLIVRCRLEQKDKVSSIFAMLTPLS